MLIQLNVKQFGIIEKANIELKSGLTVLTGETGAGKSMILAAISQLSGQRTSTSYIRHGQEKASVEGIFDYPKDTNLDNILDELEIEKDEETIIIRRDIYSSGKSVCRINNSIVSLSLLKKVAVYLLDIHEQHDNQILLSEKNHLLLLDAYAKENIQDSLKLYQEKYLKYKNVNSKIEKMKELESSILQKIDFLKFQYHEISSLKLEKDEDIKLQEESDYLSNYEKISSISNQISYSLSKESGVLENIYSIKNDLEKLSRYSSNFDEKLEEMSNIYYILEDLKYELSRFSDDIDFDERKLDRIELRLSKIKSLEKKYSKPLNELIEYQNQLSSELFELENHEENFDKYLEEEKILKEELLVLANQLSGIRKSEAAKLEKLIQEELKFLCMEKSIIKIDFKEKELANDGIDDVKILISANFGEPLKSLSKVASGGELSRIMLALKIIFASSIDAISIIFDEIDTGVSGRVSQRMAEKMYQLALNSQVLCISHLPRTTALADYNLFIKKEIFEDRTISNIKELNENEKIEEIARMISGNNKTRLSIEHAIEMLEQAKKIKEEIKG